MRPKSPVQQPVLATMTPRCLTREVPGQGVSHVHLCHRAGSLGYALDDGAGDRAVGVGWPRGNRGRSAVWGLVGYSFGGFTASRIAVEHPDVPVVYVAAWIPRDGASVLDIFAGGDPFEAGEEAGIAGFDGLILSAGTGLCALNIDRYVAAADPGRAGLGADLPGADAASAGHRGVA